MALLILNNRQRSIRLAYYTAGKNAYQDYIQLEFTFQFMGFPMINFHFFHIVAAQQFTNCILTKV